MVVQVRVRDMVGQLRAELQELADRSMQLERELVEHRFCPLMPPLAPRLPSGGIPHSPPDPLWGDTLPIDPPQGG